MTRCPQCSAETTPDLLFCRECGAVVIGASLPPELVRSAPPATASPPGGLAVAPAGFASASASPPSPALPPLSPPAEWIPPRLVGKAQHCRVCNTLISRAAVYCPACGGAQAVPGVAAGADAPPR